MSEAGSPHFLSTGQGSSSTILDGSVSDEVEGGVTQQVSGSSMALRELEKVLEEEKRTTRKLQLELDKMSSHEHEEAAEEWQRRSEAVEAEFCECLEDMQAVVAGDVSARSPTRLGVPQPVATDGVYQKVKLSERRFTLQQLELGRSEVLESSRERLQEQHARHRRLCRQLELIKETVALEVQRANIRCAAGGTLDLLPRHARATRCTPVVLFACFTPHCPDPPCACAL